MAINLQIEKTVSSTAQPAQDQSGNTSSLTLSTDNVGIGTTNPTQRFTLGSGNIFLPTANAGVDENFYFGGITDAGRSVLLRAACVVVVAVSLGVSSARAAEYFVSPSGNDLNPGTQTRPKLTIQAALRDITLMPGDKLNLRQGVYVGPVLVADKHGTADKPIVIRSFEGESTSIDGTLEAFRTLNNNDWVPAWPNDPSAHPDEYVSKMPITDFVRGAFLNRNPYTRLIAYSELADLRARNETFARILDPTIDSRYPDPKGSYDAITFIPPPSFPAETDGNDYFRLGNTLEKPYRYLGYTFGDVKYDGAYFASLDELRSSVLFQQSKSQYPPGYEAQSIETNPKFRKMGADGNFRSTDDLRLDPTSPAIGAGIVLPPDLRALDRFAPANGNPDVGCYPFGRAPLRVGVDGRKSYPATNP